MGPWMKARELSKFTEQMTSPPKDDLTQVMEKIAGLMLTASSGGFKKVSYFYDSETLSENDAVKIMKQLKRDGYKVIRHGSYGITMDNAKMTRRSELEISWE